jgi:hypothetical protein
MAEEIQHHNDIYGFEKESWEAKTTPVAEAFWHFTHPFVAKKWMRSNQNR